MNNKKVDIDLRGQNYIEEKIKLGNTLSNIILENVDLKIGRAFTIIPDNFDKSIIYNFDNYIGINQEIFQKELESIIEFFLKKDINNLVVLENSIARKNDKIIEEFESKLQFFNEEVYHILDYSNISMLTLTINEASNTWNNIIYLVSNVPKELKSHKKLITIDDLRLYASNIKSIIVDAYDLDGFIGWENYFS